MRAVRWQPVPVVAALTAVLLVVARATSVDRGPGRLWLLRAVALVLAAAVPFALDDRLAAHGRRVPDHRSLARTLAVLRARRGPCRRRAGRARAPGLRSATGAAVPVAALTLEAAGVTAAAVAAALALCGGGRSTTPAR